MFAIYQEYAMVCDFPGDQVQPTSRSTSFGDIQIIFAFAILSLAISYHYQLLCFVNCCLNC